MTPTVARGEERMLYTAQCTHDGLQAGIVYDLDPEDVEYRADAIEAGFLVRSGWAGSAAFDWPEPEVLSTVGRPSIASEIDVDMSDPSAEPAADE